MFLSVKELELRKIRFEETYQPGRIDFAGEDLEQSSPLHVAGSAEVLAHSDGEVRIQGKYTVEMAAQCDRCLGRARFPLDGGFDLYYRPVSFIAREEEVEIGEDEVEIGFYEGGGLELGTSFGNRCCWLCPCSGLAAKTAREFVRSVAGTGMRPRAIAESRAATIAGERSGN